MLFVQLCSAFLHAQSPAYDLAAARSYYLPDLIEPHDYTPGKNSFLFQNLHRGDRRTLLDLTGRGSVRHIWSTWSIPGDNSDVPAPRRVFLRVFVDGESRPSIAGSLDDLCRAAEATGAQYIPLPAFNYKGAFNLYLPIFFDKSIRIEIEATDEIQEFYSQIDYRMGEQARTSARLVSEGENTKLKLKYIGSLQLSSAPSAKTIQRTAELGYAAASPAEINVNGPGVLRSLTFRGNQLADLQLEIYFDGHAAPDIQAPLRYFFADFVNTAMESTPDQSTCYFPMPFRKSARILIKNLSGAFGRLTIAYSFEHTSMPARTLYFHAQFHETEHTVGYSQYSALDVHGSGLFVGINLFDSGHNHGGGDAALIDAGTRRPLVLHGICGEDYFSFAWHHTGTMTPLTGAPVHERRYRLHLENPYPFHESFQFLVGMFAGQHPKSVAFWYQIATESKQAPWQTFDVPWQVLGPMSTNAAIPSDVSEDTFNTNVPIDQLTKLTERWQQADMRSGFLDTTYHFRHYALTDRGTGFVAGENKTRMITYVYSPSPRTVAAIIGHDDEILVALNSKPVANIPGWKGFGGAPVVFRLHAGWNKLDLLVYNEENVDWRWSGCSLAFERSKSNGLRFAAQLPESGSPESSAHAPK